MRPETTSKESGDPFPGSNLTRAQSLLWLGQSLTPDCPLYNMAVAIYIPGAFDHARFSAAVASVVARSDALRSIFTEQGGLPHRAVLPRLDCAPELLDVSAEADPEEAAREIMRARSQRLFDLGSCLIDTAVLRLRADMHVWFVNQHHLITDVSSASVLVDAVKRAYAAGGSEDAPLPPFEDFALWEAVQAQTPRAAARRRFWHSADRADFAPVALRADSGVVQDSRERRLSVRLSPDKVRAFSAFAERPDIRMFSRQMSCFAILATALVALLHRLSGEDRVAIGAASQNRGGPSFAGTLGCFVELYPLCAVVDKDETLLSLLAKVQQETRNFLMNAHPGAATADMQRRFNVVLNYIVATIAYDPQAPETEWIHTGHSDPNHTLRVEVQDFAGRGDVTVMFDISEAMFGADDAIADQFLAVFTAMIEAPETRLAHLVLPGESVVQTPLVDNAEMLTPIQETDRIAAQHADLPAVRDDDGTVLTYAALNEAATGLAQRLIAQQGVRPGDPVALMGERSATMIVGLLAILKAGAAFVPLDPNAPEARWQEILEDTGARLVLVPDDASRHLPVRSLHIPAALNAPSVNMELPHVQADDPAYVIYTSGSTGAPNGAMIEHGNIAHLVAGLRSTVFDAAPAGLRVALVAPLVFDASIQQIFGALMQGHCLYIAPEDARLNGAALAKFYDRHKIDISDGSPAHLGLLTDAFASHEGALPDRFLIGGEPLMRHQLEAFFAAIAPNAPDVINVYGVAECCVDSVARRIRKDELAGLPARAPIGEPLPGTTVWIVNSAGLPQPPMVEGEIVIGGAGVGRGYLNRDALTGQRFRFDPDAPGQRQYRTGDIGWIDAQGVLHFKGRRDSQINLRGVRIELAEIEHHLRAYQAILPSQSFDQPARRAQGVIRCTRCVLSANYPGVTLNADGLCSVCENWSRNEDAAQAYFQDMGAFDALMARAAAERPAQGAYDCMLLYSGGKDSSYVLHRLVERGLRVLAFTFDNGFISKAAFETIRRQTEALGVTSIIERTTHMDDIFVESLRLDQTVCSGCFRALTAISTRIAHSMGINVVITGLSRGQIFDTKLDALFRQGITDIPRIEQNLTLFRQIFHANRDRTAALLDLDLDDTPITGMHFVDFFRYDATGVNGVRAYLRERDAFWRTPQDTGFCSSNCLMNDVGICVHSNRRNYHNYESPLSWDVRLGVSDRADVMWEIEAPLNLKRVQATLKRIGFYEKRVRDVRVLVETNAAAEPVLVAYFTASQTVEPAELRTWLAARLPAYMVPSRFVQVDRIPLTPNGKVDDRALAALGRMNADRTEKFAPTNAVETALVEIWQAVLEQENIGIRDNFYDLGGDSIGAIRIVGRANAQGLRVNAADLLNAQTIEALAKCVIGQGEELRTAKPATGPQTPTPLVQSYLAAAGMSEPGMNAMVMDLDLGRRVDHALLQRALGETVRHHDVFRLRALHGPDGWRLAYAAQAVPSLRTLKPVSAAHVAQIGKAALRKLAGALSLAKGPLISAAIMPVEHGNDHLLLALHHVTCDFISLSVFVEDLHKVYTGMEVGQHPDLPMTSTSYQAWADAAAERLERMPGNIRIWRRRLGDGAGAMRLGADADEHGYAAFYASRDVASLRAFFKGEAQGVISEKDAVLSALAYACAAHTGRSRIQLDLESHGRAGALDVSRTMGWFTALYPAMLDVRGDADFETLLSITEQGKAAAERSRSFIDLPGEIAEGLPKSDILLNYIGRWGALGVSGWRLAAPVDQVLGPDVRTPRPAIMTVSRTPERLTLYWQFDPARASRSVLEQLSADFFDALEQLAASACAHSPAIARAAELARAGVSVETAARVDAAFDEADR